MGLATKMSLSVLWWRSWIAAGARIQDPSVWYLSVFMLWAELADSSFSRLLSPPKPDLIYSSIIHRQIISLPMYAVTVPGSYVFFVPVFMIFGFCINQSLLIPSK